MAFAPVSPFTLTGLNKFLSLTYHQMINWAIYTFAELNLADQLIRASPDRGYTVEEIIGEDRKQWNSQLIYRILRACVYAGIVELVNDDKHFVLTESGIMMTSDHPSHVRDNVLYTFGKIYIGANQQLPNIARGEGTGTGVARAFGGLDLYALLSQPDYKDFASRFNGCMTSFSMQTSVQLVKSIDFNRFKTMADIGGNRGTFLAEIFQNFPQIEHGIVFDLPHIINSYSNGEEFQSRGIDNDRWSYVSGDMFDALTVPLADAYVFKYILHNYDDEKCLQILSSLRQTNKTKQNLPITIFIVEHIILPDGAISNWQTHGFDIVMAAVFDNARERTEDEYKQLLYKTGFQFQKLYPIQAPESVIEAICIE